MTRKDFSRLIEAVKIVEEFGFEGFTEAMSLGVIPIGFDSFNAIYDMIDDGVDGFIIPDNNYEQYAATILRLAGDDTLRCQIAHKAQTRKSRYDIEHVGPLWMDTFRRHGLI